MRTAYQGMQFEFMMKEMRRPDVQTIDEMIEKNFTLYMPDAKFKHFSNMDFMNR